MYLVQQFLDLHCSWLYVIFCNLCTASCKQQIFGGWVQFLKHLCAAVGGFVLQLIVGLSERAGESLPFVLVAAKDDLGMSNVSCAIPSVQLVASSCTPCIFALQADVTDASAYACHGYDLCTS